LIFAFGLALSASARAGAADPPKISKPRPAPPGAPTQMPALPPAQLDNKLNIGGDDIDAKKAETRMSVEVEVNGRGPYHFVVDSGADTSVVGLHIAQALQLPLAAPAILDGMTDRAIVDRVKVDQLTLGPSVIRNLELPALREQDLGGDGMIGIDALTHQRLMMDFEKKIIKVEDARLPERHFPDEIVVTARRQRGQLILTEVRAAGLPLDAVIDTGSEISVGNLALRDKLLHGGGDKNSTVAMIGVTGKALDVQVAIISDLQLGPITLRDVPIAFADLPPFKVFGLSDQPSLLLGTDVLQTFRRVSLDFRARKVRFQLNRCATQLVTIGMSWEPSRLSANGGADVCDS
jgi:predicted aspartyl protease